MPEVETHAAVAELVRVNAVINTEPSSIRERVIYLGHAHAEAMCAAIAGDTPARTHCDLSPAQIRRVMRKHKCLICPRSPHLLANVGKSPLVTAYPEISCLCS